MASNSTTFRVTHVYDVTLNHGEIPTQVIADLIEKAAEAWPPSLNVGGGDYFLGAGSDFGDGTTAEVSVEVK